MKRNDRSFAELNKGGDMTDDQFRTMLMRGARRAVELNEKAGILSVNCDLFPS